MRQKKIRAFRAVLQHFDPDCPMPDEQLVQFADLMFDNTIDMNIDAEEQHKRTVMMLAIVRNFALISGMCNVNEFLAYFASEQGEWSYPIINKMIDEACASAVVGAEKVSRPEQLN